MDYEFYMKISNEVEVCESINDVGDINDVDVYGDINNINMEYSILDNECKTHECIDVFRTYEVKVTAT